MTGVGWRKRETGREGGRERARGRERETDLGREDRREFNGISLICIGPIPTTKVL